MICSGVWRLRFMGLLLAKSGRLGSSHKDWFSFWGPRQRNGSTIDWAPLRHRIADAAIGAETGSDTGSIGAQLKRHGAGFVAGPKGKRAPGWQLMARMMEAAGDLTAAGLYATPRVESFCATVPGLQYAQHDPEDLDTTGPDHTADACKDLVVAAQDPRYSYRASGTEHRVW
jgi:hypothetical protein